MGLWGFRSREVRVAGAVALLCMAPITSGCANSSYAGIPLNIGAASSELQSIARRAQAGDKQAQLELGIRYEEGRGVAIDQGKARAYYAMAAADSGGVLHVYTPPVGRNGSGRVVTVDRGPRQAGLAEAKVRLAKLK